ncbi:response regulator [Butyrivibrio sp. FCS014]|uniref:response regulator n=1 Tax=Butyrivibrio sp. FCS014 TaxID=1408304 RepID=UPI0004668F21|nr:response regulator [Butyrivibrio sp. FCS014]
MRRLFRKLAMPMDKREVLKIIIHAVMVIFTAVYTVKYNQKMYHVDNMSYGIAGIIYAFRYLPVLVTTALGGAVPGMMSIILVFIYYSVAYSSFSYLTFIYLLAACVIDVLVKKKWFNRSWKIFPAMIVLMNLLGTFWGIVLLLLSDYGIYTISVRQVVMLFLNELPGSLLCTVVIYLLLNKLPEKTLLLFGNGKYYVDPRHLSEDDRYVVEGRSRIGKVVMNIIVFEALVLGIFAELASNTLIPTMKEHEELSAPAQRSVFSYVGSTDRIESMVSLDIMRDSRAESDYITGLLASDRASTLNIKFSVRLAMLISIIVIPMAVFMNRYAQRRIVAPIRLMSKSMSEIYNSNEDNLDENIRKVHDMDIRTGDEIEELYHTMDLTVYRLVEYIQLVRTRQTIEDQLRVAKSASEAKSRFLSNISHEIRTPINAVLGFDEMIIRESKDESILSYARDIQDSGRTLLALINDVLDFSKIEAGKIDLIPVEYELGSLLNDLVNMSQMRAREKDLEFNINVNEKIPHVLFGDEIRIKQCILNIVTNGVKYTEKGSVTLNIDYEIAESENPQTEEDNILLKVSVEDTGIGIREEDMEKLSAAFERVDETRNRTIEGTGLGISIVTSLLELMDSKLEIKSEYGKGSIFSFKILQNVVDWEPIGDFEKKVREVRSESDAYTESFHAPEARILVVDDTRTNLTVIKGLLKFTKMQVDTATSGVEAIEMARYTKYNMIFLDHRMPEMDGIQTFHAMQEMAEDINRDTPVIALTANAISGSREMYFKEGFTNYMAKPVDPAKLEEMILMYLPPELVSKPGDVDFETEGTTTDEEKEALQELLGLSGVDVNAAISRCGSATLAREVMRDFWQSIEERADKIEHYESIRDIKDYTIFVHGLKSSAKAIGALDLSEKAKYLENCGNGGDIDEIEELTPELLELYRSYLTKLEPILEKEDDGDKPMISEEELENAFASIKEFVSASYFDSADDIMGMLEGYSIPEGSKEKYREVKRLLSAVDRDGLLNVL